MSTKSLCESVLTGSEVSERIIIHGEGGRLDELAYWRSYRFRLRRVQWQATTQVSSVWAAQEVRGHSEGVVGEDSWTLHDAGVR